MDSILNKTSETDFNSTLLDDGTLFPSHTISLNDLQNNNNKNKINEGINDINNNTKVSENHRNRRSVNSTKLTQNLDPLKHNYSANTLCKYISNPLISQNSVPFNTEPVILYTSTQPASTNNQITRLTPQQLLNCVNNLILKTLNRQETLPPLRI